MANSFSYQRLRRLPVFFMLDTSKEMGGTFQVTMQDGLLVVKSELAEYPEAAQHVYLGGVTFGEKATSHSLVPLDTFNVPGWQAQGQCNLKPALISLTEALTFDLIATRPDRPGDYAPLVFLILGGEPCDTWPDALGELAAINDNRRPLITILVTRPALVDKMKTISKYVLLLKAAEAAYLTYFFFWVARTIVKICEASEHGATTIDFPALPYGVVVPS